jgi:hypothetical protein
MPAPNYCTISDAVRFAGGKLTELDFEDAWLDMVDAMIEQHAGQGYKGEQKLISLRGQGTRLLRLPSIARQIVKITEIDTDTELLDSEFRLQTGGRLLKRTNNLTISYGGMITYQGVWCRGYEYEITYYEPGIESLPEVWHLTALNLMAVVAHFVQKYKQFGLALTASDYASATKVATQASTTFPANLMEEIKRTLQHSIRRASI